MHLLVLRSFLGPFAAGFSISLFLLVLPPVIRLQEQLFGKGFSIWVILQFIGYLASTFTVEAIALGVLLSTLMTMGKLGEQYELAALKASGISLWRVLQPLLAFGLVLFVAALAFSFFIKPWSNLKMYTLMYDIKQAKPSFALKPGMFNTLIDGYTIRAADRDGDLLREVHIYDHSKYSGATKVIVADSGRMQIDNRLLFLRMELYHGEQYEELQSSQQQTGQGFYPFARVRFDTLYFKLDLSDWGLKRTDETLFMDHQYMNDIVQLVRRNDSISVARPRMLNRVRDHIDLNLQVGTWLSDSLQAAVAGLPLDSTLRAAGGGVPTSYRLTQTADLLRGLRNFVQYQQSNLENQLSAYRGTNRELHLRFTMPLAVVLFLIIGASLGAIIRKGGLGAPVLAAILLFAVFYILLTTGRNMAQEGVLPVWMAMWMPIAVMVPLAVFLAYQSATDSPLLDLGAWKILLARWRRRWLGAGAGG